LTWVAYIKGLPIVRQVSKALGFHDVSQFEQCTLRLVSSMFIIINKRYCLQLCYYSACDFFVSTGGYILCLDLISTYKHLLMYCLEVALSIPTDREALLTDSDSFLFYTLTCWQYYLEHCVMEIS
jgi:hypothetical protein